MVYIIFGAVFVLSLVLLWWSFETDSDFGMVTITIGILGLTFSLVGTGVYTAYEADKRRCLNSIQEVSGKETKWIDGECFVKADDGKFVPLKWIEEGYDRD